MFQPNRFSCHFAPNPAACSARLSFGVGVENNGMKAPLTTQNVDCSYDILRGAIPGRILFKIWTSDRREWLEDDIAAFS